MNDMQKAKLNSLLAEGQEGKFYDWKAWDHVREKVLEMDHYECQMCKARGRYAPAYIVHHVKHLRDRPDLALSIWDGDQRQLVAVCKACHEKEHPEALRQFAPGEIPVTAERWD